MKALLSALLLLLAVSACRHPIEIVGDGDVMSASGNRDCLLEDYQARLANCVKNDVAGAYQETYYAVPRAGWQFGGWGHYCASSSDNEGCNFNFTAEQVEQYADESMPSLVAYFRREITTAHKAVLMGHSFFDPIASNMVPYFRRAGFEGHTQKSFVSGGGGGAPISFWENGGDNNTAIKKALDEGGNTLLGMTYYPMPDVDRNFQGFRNWVEYARNKNPAITVFLSIAWPQNPSAQELKQYREPWKSTYHEEIHAFTDALRKEFPDNKFYCIPYGLAGIELKKLFEAGALPEINALVGEYNTAVFSDDQGHMNGMLVELASLMWLRAIYGTDLLSYQYSSNYSTDLTVLAQTLLARHDHHYSAP